MRTTEEIRKKIQEKMKEELKAFEECEEARKWAENRDKPEYAKDMKTGIQQHLAGYARLSVLLDWINEK